MSKVRFQDGTVINFGEHTPTPAEIEEAYGQVKGSSQSAPQDRGRFEASRQATEAEIASRPSYVRNLNERGFTGPTKGITTGLMSLLERGEGAIADIGLGLQRGAGLKEIVGDINKTASGQRPAQFGDILRASNLPVVSSRPVSAVMGMSMLPGGAKGVVDLSRIGLKAGQGALSAMKAPVQTAGDWFQALKAIPATTRKRFPTVAKDIRSAYQQISTHLQDQFADSMTQLQKLNPNAKVNVRNVVERAKLLASENPAFATRLDSAVRRAFPKGDVTLAELLNNPQLADNVTLQQSEQLLASLKSVPSLPSKLARQGASYTDVDMDLLDLARDIRQSQLETFPQFQKDISKYADVSEKLRQTKNFFKESRLESSVKGGFGSAEQEQTVASILPKDTMKKVIALRRGESLKRAGGVAGKTAAIAGLGGTAGKLAWDLFTQ